MSKWWLSWLRFRMGDKSDKQIDNCANKTAGAQRAFRKSECWHQAQEGTWRGGWGRNRENPEQKPKACDARERVPAQAREAIEGAEQGRGLVSQIPQPTSEVRQGTWVGARRRSRGNPPKKRKPCKRASAGLVRLPCRPTCCHSGGHPVYYRHGAESQSREQGGNLGKTRTKASQAVGSEWPRELSWDSQFGVFECCGVIFLSLGIGPYIQKYLIDEPRHKKLQFKTAPKIPTGALGPVFQCAVYRICTAALMGSL